jgi:hypothetical protein
MTTGPAPGCAVGRELGAVPQSAHGPRYGIDFIGAMGAHCAHRRGWDGERCAPRKQARLAASRGTTRMSNMRTGARSGPAHEARCTRVYRRRRPERTVLYQVVQHNLESWLAQLRETDPDNDPIPWYVERDYRRYLDCGLLCCGFARARCQACGHDFLLAFCCSTRGVCPSCTTRHMADDCRDAGGRAMQEQLPKRRRIWSTMCSPKCRWPLLRILRSRH